MPAARGAGLKQVLLFILPFILRIKYGVDDELDSVCVLRLSDSTNMVRCFELYWKAAKEAEMNRLVGEMVGREDDVVFLIEYSLHHFRDFVEMKYCKKTSTFCFTNLFEAYSKLDVRFMTVK